MRLVYNDLNGDEIKKILVQRFSAMLDATPYLQRHITIPRVRMNVAVVLEQWADQPEPQKLQISDETDIVGGDYKGLSAVTDRLEDTVNASPTRGGIPPDQIREQSGLAVITAMPMRDSTGRKIVTSDVPVLDGSVVEEVPGLRIDRTGMADQMAGATVVRQDFGIAGIGNAPRDPRRDGQAGLSFGNQTSGRGPVEGPRIHREKE